MRQPSDERLKAIAKGHELYGDLERLNIMEHEITQMAAELLSLRSLNKRLVEYARCADNCRHHNTATMKCDCGFYSVKKEIGEQK